MTTVGRYSLAIPIDLYLERREAMDEGTQRPARAGLARLLSRRASTAAW